MLFLITIIMDECGGTTDMNGEFFDDFHKKYPNIPIGLSEYGCEALNWHTSNPVQVIILRNIRHTIMKN